MKIKKILFLKTHFKDIAVYDTIRKRDYKYKSINKSQMVKKFEKRKRRLQRGISRKYEQNKEKGKYCKTNNIVKNEKVLLKVKHRLTNIRKKLVSSRLETITKAYIVKQE